MIPSGRTSVPSAFSTSTASSQVSQSTRFSYTPIYSNLSVKSSATGISYVWTMLRPSSMTLPFSKKFQALRKVSQQKSVCCSSLTRSIRITFETLSDNHLTSLLLEMTRTVSKASVYQDQSFDVIKYLLLFCLIVVITTHSFALAWSPCLTCSPSPRPPSRWSIRTGRRARSTRRSSSPSHSWCCNP